MILKKNALVCLIVFIVLFTVLPAFCSCYTQNDALMTAADQEWMEGVFSGSEDIDEVGVCYEIADKDGRLLTKMSRKPYPGDQLLTPEGNHYTVIEVKNYKAVAEPAGKDKRFLEIVSHIDELQELPASSLNWQNRPVAIYHTHSDESYLPSDGKASIPFNGGIFQVGSTVTDSLERRGAKALHDLTPHDPHDANAYIRSRKTAVNLIKNTNPVALFDVHRDGIDDPEFYQRTVGEENVTQIRIVVGRQNPKMQANLEFAKKLMAYANKKHPGIVKEIFMANGNYNQDLISTALLFEAGTYTNYKSEAQKGIDFLASSVPVVLGLTGPEQVDRAVDNRAFLTALGLIILVLLLAAAFIYINAGPGEIKEYIRSVKEKGEALINKFQRNRN